VVVVVVVVDDVEVVLLVVLVVLPPDPPLPPVPASSPHAKAVATVSATKTSSELLALLCRKAPPRKIKPTEHVS
jgi:hypothetical protein